MGAEDRVFITEVGPRDGLQNEAQFLATTRKIAFIDALSQTGLPAIEASSFVSAKKIPQLQDAKAVLAGITRHPNIAYSVLVPNEQGMQEAIASGIRQIAIFTAASERFNQQNIHCSIQESLERYRPVMQLAKTHGISVRGYISCVLGCPYEGKIKVEKVRLVAEALWQLGVDELSLGDTIGVGNPHSCLALLRCLQASLPLEKLALHFHDSYGQALANLYTALEFGIRRFDASVAGLGGCPYAKGATGNVATEDVLYLLEGLGLKTGVDLLALAKIGQQVCQDLQKSNESKAARAILAKAEDSH